MTNSQYFKNDLTKSKTYWEKKMVPLTVLYSTAGIKFKSMIIRQSDNSIYESFIWLHEVHFLGLWLHLNGIRWKGKQMYIIFYVNWSKAKITFSNIWNIKYAELVNGTEVFLALKWLSMYLLMKTRMNGSSHILQFTVLYILKKHLISKRT